MNKVCLWEFGVNILLDSLMTSSVFHSGGSLGTIEDWVLRNLDTSRGREWVMGGNGVFAM